MRQRDIENPIHDGVARAVNLGGARALVERGRDLGARLGRHGSRYGRQLVSSAEDLADHASYGVRRVRRQVSRHPVATAAIVAGTIGAFLLLRRAFRHRDDDID